LITAAFLEYFLDLPEIFVIVDLDIN
jgi:hypothetical protein